VRVSYEWDEAIGPVVRFHTTQRTIGFCFCHKRKDRCITFFGLDRYLCARCVGIVAGIPVGIVTVLLNIQFNFLLSVGLMIPMALDGLSQAMGYRESNNLLRLITGFIFSLGFIMAASVVTPHSVFSTLKCLA